MEKVIQFTEEEKQLIYTTKIAATNAFAEEVEAFIAVCESYGLHPLQGDILFQRFETKYGPRVSYIVSRDGLLKHANRQADFISINAGVVREGDNFAFDVDKEIVSHSFGAKRGNVIGAWAVLKTKNKGNILEYVDYQEYRAALAEKNKLWNTMPSAMIKKTAQSNAIKLAFPLGVQFVVEGELIEDFEGNNKEFNSEISQEMTENNPFEQLRNQTTTEELEKVVSEQPKEVQSLNDNTPGVKEEKAEVNNEQSSTETVPVQDQEKENVQTVQQQEETKVVSNDNDNSNATTEEPMSIPTETKESTVKPLKDVPADAYVYQTGTHGKSPTTEKQFIKVTALQNGVQVKLFVEENVIPKFKNMVEGTVFKAKTEVNGQFKIIVDPASVEIL